MWQMQICYINVLGLVCKLTFPRKLQTNATTFNQVTYSYIMHTFISLAMLMVIGASSDLNIENSYLQNE